MTAPVKGASAKAPVDPSEAQRLMKLTPDPPALRNILANNSLILCSVAKLVHIMCDGKPGQAFFLGGETLAAQLEFLKPGLDPRVALRWLEQLERLGVIRCTWRGGLCIRDAEGKPYRKAFFIPTAAGRPTSKHKMLPRASEYVYLGLPSVPTRVPSKKSVRQSSLGKHPESGSRGDSESHTGA